MLARFLWEYHHTIYIVQKYFEDFPPAQTTFAENKEHEPI